MDIDRRTRRWILKNLNERAKAEDEKALKFKEDGNLIAAGQSAALADLCRTRRAALKKKKK